MVGQDWRQQLSRQSFPPLSTIEGIPGGPPRTAGLGEDAHSTEGLMLGAEASWERDNHSP